MPAPTIMDLGSGMDTRGTIKKLMELERIPIKRLEKQNQVHTIRIQAWEETRKRSKKLADSSRSLHSFAGSFAINTVVSSDPGAITGQATPDVETGKQEIDVVQLATHHQMHTNPLPVKEQLAAGSFSVIVDGKEIDFEYSGGTPRGFQRYLAGRGKSIFDTNGIQVDADNLMIALRSKKSGKHGQLQFTDPDGLLAKIGLLGLSETEELVAEEREMLFKQTALHVNARASKGKTHTIAKAGKELQLGVGVDISVAENLSQKAIVQLEYVLSEAPSKNNPPAAKPGGTESPDINNPTTTPDQKAAEDTIKNDGSRITVGPDIKVQVGDVELKGQNIERRRHINNKDSQVAGENSDTANTAQESEPGPLKIQFGVQWEQNGQTMQKMVEREVAADGGQGQLELKIGELSGGQRITALRIMNATGVAVVRNVHIQDEIKKKRSRPANETMPALDAILKINGIEVKRSQNRALTDIMEGVSLDLNRKTDGPVTVSVETRSDDIIKEIQAWVEAYNDMLHFCREISQTGTPAAQSGPNPQDGSKQSGMFASDSTIRQLVARVRMVTARSYPVLKRDGYRILADIGITTGAPGQNWNDIKSGMLHLDESRLRARLSENPDAVRALFASDTNEDNINDNGVAINMENSLKPYNRGAGGLITARILMLKDRIKSNKTDMYRKELSLKSKETSLRRKFGYMERSVRRNRMIGDTLKRQDRSGR